MIELFKIIKGVYDPACVPHFKFSEMSEDCIRTRGNQYKLSQYHCHYDLRKYNFTNRVIPIWNSLSNHVVSAETINTFKNRLVSSGLIRKCCITIEQISMASETAEYSVVFCHYNVYYIVISRIQRPLKACFRFLHVMWCDVMMGHLTCKNPSPIWSIMRLVGRFTLLIALHCKLWTSMSALLSSCRPPLNLVCPFWWQVLLIIGRAFGCKTSFSRLKCDPGPVLSRWHRTGPVMLHACGILMRRNLEHNGELGWCKLEA